MDNLQLSVKQLSAMPLKYLLPAVLLCLSCITYAQENTELLTFNQKRLQTNKIGMLTLGSWALVNIGTGAIAASQAVGSNKHFHQMNAYWNVVNLALAGFGYYGSITADPASFNLFASIKEHYGMEKILLLNAGLDVGYIVTGLYLTERAKNSVSQADRLKGFGQSITLQGSFLLVFDAAMFLIHNSHIKQLKSVLDNITFNGNTVGVALHF
jgi:hypothetical protein